MAALGSVLIAVTLSLLLTRIATQALAMTGLSRQSAEFQARSAFTGAGFTTSESEQVVNHPVRRRIIMLLMFLGNVGIITVISSLVLTFISTAGPNEWSLRLLFLGLGLAFLWILATNPWIDRLLSRSINWALARWTDLDVQDYANLLHLSGEYGVRELEVRRNDWLADQSLNELRLRSEGVLVLGIQRYDGDYIGVPKGSTVIRPNDILILYGRLKSLSELDRRQAGTRGKQAHDQAVAEQREVMQEQDRRDWRSRV